VVRTRHRSRFLSAGRFEADAPEPQQYALDGRLGSLDADDYTKAESIRLELGVDVDAGLSGQKPRRIVVVSQVPKLILEVDQTKVQGSILVVVHAPAELVNNAIVRLTILISNVPGTDQEVAIRAKSPVNVVPVL
jgi:hypothetical protein